MSPALRVTSWGTGGSYGLWVFLGSPPMEGSPGYSAGLLPPESAGGRMLARTHGDVEGHGERLEVVSPELRAALVGARPLFIYEGWQVSSGLFSWCNIQLPAFCSKVSPSRGTSAPAPRCSCCSRDGTEPSSVGQGQGQVASRCHKTRGQLRMSPVLVLAPPAGNFRDAPALGAPSPRGSAALAGTWLCPCRV